MNFIDQADIFVEAGKGGDGRVSFRKEKFISRGGPDGGDGGDGGKVILQASTNQDSLAVFRYSKQLKAESGQPGGTNRKHGKSGQDLIVAVPVGTQAKDQDGNILADMVLDKQTTVIAVGGKGGFGNAHFVNSTRQAPNFADKGEPGQLMKIVLELKMLADVGLVGLPNAGKSTLLRAISNARPKIADYPFTTLNPSVGVVDIPGSPSLLFADIPGLIEGAANGKGLGHDFLRHIERTSVIVHVIDAYSADIVGDYLTIRQELGAYKKELLRRPEIVALNKTEGMDELVKNDLIASLRRTIKSKNEPIVTISALSGIGLEELINYTKSLLDTLKKKQLAKNKQPLMYEYKLPDNELAWQVQPIDKHSFMVTGAQIERFALRTDFNNDQAVARLLDILKKRGIIHALVRHGINPGDKIVIADKGELVY